MTYQHHKIECVMNCAAQSAAGDDAPTAGSAEEAAQTDNWIPYWEAVGIAFRKARKKSGFKQREIVETLGVSRAQIANTETGRTRVSMWRLKKMAELYKCDPLEMLSPPPAPPKRNVTELFDEIDVIEERLLELRAEKRAMGIKSRKPKT